MVRRELWIFGELRSSVHGIYLEEVMLPFTIWDQFCGPLQSQGSHPENIQSARWPTIKKLKRE